MDSQTWFERAKAVLPGGVNSPVRAFGSVGGQPVYIDKAFGQYLWDVEGRQYLDMIGSWGPMILGHAHPAVEAAALRALSRGASFGACCPAEVELAELVCALVPGVEMVRMTSSGTEAVMSALRLARGFTGRERIVKFDGCYHGHSDGLLSQAGSGLATQGLPGSAGVPAPVAAATITLPYNDTAAAEALFDLCGSEIAAVIVEPVAANMGVVPPAKGFLEELRRLTRDYGALLVFDEVITGFRLGLSGAQGVYGITADLTTFGKIIGGGFPVGAFVVGKTLPDFSVPMAGGGISWGWSPHWGRCTRRARCPATRWPWPLAARNCGSWPRSLSSMPAARAWHRCCSKERCRRPTATAYRCASSAWARC